ncbi:MAG: phosphatidylglycerophosphatase A [Thermoanaerobacteraceae bacterium]|nr:phosphatidylglycerophosphatase A [Thermoanaerobacteraceae bacterium]
MRQVIRLLSSRGVFLHQIGEIVYRLQKPYLPSLAMEQCINAVETVLAKREVQYAVYTGVALDMLAEQGGLPQPLQDIVAVDEPLYGLDEVLAMGITNIYGSIGITSFGYLDKEKPGVIGDLNKNKGSRVNTFLDDLVAGIAAAASAKLAHNAKDSKSQGDGTFQA